MSTYIATCSIDIAALFLLCVLIHNSSMLNSYRKKPFLFGIILTVTIILAEGGTLLAINGDAALRGFNILCNVAGFALTPVVPLALIAISDIGILRAYKFLFLPTVVNLFAAVFSPSLRLYFYVDASNHYERGDYFPVFIVVSILNLSLLLASILHTGRIHNYPIKGKMISLALFTAAGTSIQLVSASVYASWHCVTLALFLYLLLLSEFDSSFDTLTGLYNRAAFDKAAKQMAGREAFSVIVLDVNNFKNVNDTYGHDYGDSVLKAIGGIIRKSLDNHCACYRVGGDEFFILCRETNQERIEYQLKDMTKALAQKRENDNDLPTVAYGYSISRDGLNFQQILKQADEQMYRFKKLQKAQASPSETVGRQSIGLPGVAEPDGIPKSN